MIKRTCGSFRNLLEIQNVKEGEIKMRKIIVTTKGAIIASYKFAGDVKTGTIGV